MTRGKTTEAPRARARELGLAVGTYAAGSLNAITDVAGVRVGHATLVRGHGLGRPGRGPVRTGVTAIVPAAGNLFEQRVHAGCFVLAGAGELTGLAQLREWGVVETPIVLASTLAVGTCATALVRRAMRENPGVAAGRDVLVPTVAECDDSWLNDAAGLHVRERHVDAALDAASDGPVPEGNVGAGTGMITCGFTAGIGTSSRRLARDQGGYTIGVLVLSNFGRRADLRMDGVPVGRVLAPRYASVKSRSRPAGSIIVVVATDAPLLPHQLDRLATRAALGVGRVGSRAEHTSGEIVLAFSTANRVARVATRRELRPRVLADPWMDALYGPTIDATEEAILNALCAARPMNGFAGHAIPALPLAEVRAIVARHRAAEVS